MKSAKTRENSMESIEADLSLQDLRSEAFFFSQ